jgi:propanediol utilization protein
MKQELLPLVYECSARHVHLTEHAWSLLFDDALPDRKKGLSVGTETALNQKIFIPSLSKTASVLHPLRPYSQLEVSEDEHLSMFGWVGRRSSGDLAGAPSVEIIGNTGVSISIPVIVPINHVHVPKVFQGKFKPYIFLEAIREHVKVFYNDTRDNNMFVHLDVSTFNRKFPSY